MKKKQHTPADLQTFVSLLTDHQSVLRGYIRSLLPQTTEVRDVLQNTNLTLWEQRERFEPDSNFKAWAFAIARYRVMDHRKKMKKDKQLVFGDQLFELIEKKSHSKDTLDQERKQQALSTCLQQLKPQDQALISARYISNTPLESYAIKDGRTHGSLRVTLNRLRTILRDCITQQISLGKQP